MWLHQAGMEFVFAYLAGLLTLINPCVLPVLPIVLVGALNANRMGPVALAAGMSVSFVVFGVLVTAFGASVGLTQDHAKDNHHHGADLRRDDGCLWRDPAGAHVRTTI